VAIRLLIATGKLQGDKTPACVKDTTRKVGAFLLDANKKPLGNVAEPEVCTLDPLRKREHWRVVPLRWRFRDTSSVILKRTTVKHSPLTSPLPHCDFASRRNAPTLRVVSLTHAGVLSPWSFPVAISNRIATRRGGLCTCSYYGT